MCATSTFLHLCSTLHSPKPFLLSVCAFVQGLVRSAPTAPAMHGLKSAVGEQYEFSQCEDVVSRADGHGCRKEFTLLFGECAL